MSGKVNFSLAIMRSHIKELVLRFETELCSMPEIKSKEFIKR